MNFRSPSEFRFAKHLSTFATALLILAGMTLLFVSASSSQQPPRPPAWSVQSADPGHSWLTLKGSMILGIDTSMFWVVQFRIEGSGASQLASFQPSMPVRLESSGPKLQAPPALGAKTGGKVQPQANLGAKSPTASVPFTGIPTVGQTLVIEASGISPIEGVVVSVTGPQSYTAGPPGPACCMVTAFNPQTGIATAKLNTSGQIFMFQGPLAPPHDGPPPQSPSYQHINVGHPVWANLTTGQVSLDGRTACCQIQTPQGGVPQSAQIAQGGSPAQLLGGTREIDPCTITSADVLKALLQAGIQNYFPLAMDNGGEHLSISDPHVEQVTCPHMTIKVQTAFGYSRTRGFPQFQTGGSMELQSSLVAEVTFAGGPAMANAPITASNFVRAVAVLTNPQITSLQVDNIPSWIDLSWLAACLNGAYSNWGCTDVLHAMSFDVTAFVKLYLEQGNTIPPSSQSTAASQAFRQKVQLLAPKLQSANLVEAQKANAEWKSLAMQINQWATQNNIATESYRQPAGGGGGGGGGPTGGGTGSGSGSGSQTSCAPEKFSGPFWCILEGVGKNPDGSPVCVYQCYKIFH